MRVMVLGADGMLGHKMLQVLATQGFDVAGSVRTYCDDALIQRVEILRSARLFDGFDVVDWGEAALRIAVFRPDVVVNCVGVVKQRSAAKSEIPSITVNALMPHLLADLLKGWGARLIHFSTDCVFSGERGSYTEEDIADAADLYGRSKYLGEVTGENCLTLRTSIIGRELKNFTSLLEWFLAQELEPVKGYSGAIYSGVTTNYLSGLVARLLLDGLDLQGLYQVTSPAISKYELLRELAVAYGKNIRVLPDDSVACDRSMVGERFWSCTGYQQPEWSDLIRDLVADTTPYMAWRS